MGIEMSSRNNNKQNPSSYEEAFQAITNTKEKENEEQQKDQMMQKALEKLREEQSEGKREQMNKDFNEHEDMSRGIQEGLKIAADHYGSEYRNYEFGAGNRFASEEQKGRAKKDKEKQMAEDWKTAEGQESEIQSAKEKQLKIEKALMVVQESLRSLSQEDHVDPEIIKGLEKQEQDLIFQLNNFSNQESSVVSMEKSSGVKNLEDSFNKAPFIEDAQIQNEDGSSNSKEKTEDKVESEKDDKEQEAKQKQALDSRTQGTLAKMGVSFDELVEAVPDFAYMSEGARAFVLDKVQQQSVEKIQDNSETLFQDMKSKSPLWKKIFAKGSLSREAKRQAVQEYKGLENYKDDIQTMVQFVEDTVIKGYIDRDIVIDEKTNKPRIEYMVVPKDREDDKEMVRVFKEYNRAATNLVNIPYEWSLSDAEKEQKEKHEQAEKYFKAQEEALKSLNYFVEKKENVVENIIHTENVYRDVKLAQLMSTHPDVAQDLERMEKAGWWSDLSYKVKAGGAGFVIGSVSRLSSRALWGLGGAVGASALLGGYLGVVKKNKEFKQDAKDVRRGKDLKDTTNKVFHADKNINRLDKLADALIKKSEKSPESIKRSAEAVQDRLRMLDQRLREGRVNFGKGKDQLKNKHELMRAMAHASMVLYEVEKVDTSTFVPERVRQYFERKDQESLSNRRKSRVRAAVIGGSIGASAAFVGALAVDYFKGGELLETIKEKIDSAISGPEVTPPNPVDPVSPIPPQPIDSNLPPREIVVPPMAPLDPETFTPKDFEVSVDASSRGAIATFEDLKNQLRVVYPDMSQAPEPVQEFMKKSATQLAMEENMFRPDHVDESAKIYKGGKLGFAKNGQLVYLDPRSGFHNLSEGQFTGDHFDYGGTRAAAGQVDTGLESKPQSTYTPQTVNETNPRPPYLEGVDDNTGVRNSDKSMSQIEEINARNERIAQESGFEKKMGPDSRVVPLMKGQALEFELSAKDGGIQTDFFEIDSKILEAYHEAYLNTDIDSYADTLFQSKAFMNANPDVSKVGVDSKLRQLVNAMVARDLALQKGGFFPASEEFQVLKHERDVLRSIIKNKYESFVSSPLVGSFEGVKNPNPTAVLDAVTPTSSVEQAVPQNDNVFPGFEKEKPSNPSVESSEPDSSLFPGFEKETPSEQILETDEPQTQEDSLQENADQQELKKLPTIYCRDTTALKGAVVNFFENEKGELVKFALQREVNIDTNFVDLGEFGFDFDEAEKLKSTSMPNYERTKIASSMERIYSTKAIRDTFSMGSREYHFLNKELETLIRIFDTSYPKVFNLEPERI